MSSWLQRLAARALGQAPTVRPIVGGRAPPVPARVVLPDASPDAAPTAAPAETLRDVAPPFAANPLQARSHREPRTPAVLQRPSPAAMRPAPRPTPVPEVGGEASPAAAAPERDRAPVADRFALLLPVTPSTSPSSPASPSRGPRAVPRPTKPDTPAPAREELTEVHVSIGRIELTAVQDAPRPRREPARTRKPQSLEEYLKRREAERR
jgi:hypothetical protein